MADPTYRHLCGHTTVHKYKAWGAASCSGGTLPVHHFTAPSQHNCSHTSTSANSGSISCDDENGAPMGKVLIRVYMNGHIDKVREYCRGENQPPQTSGVPPHRAKGLLPNPPNPTYLYAWVCCEPKRPKERIATRSALPVIAGVILLGALIIFLVTR